MREPSTPGGSTVLSSSAKEGLESEVRGGAVCPRQRLSEWQGSVTVCTFHSIPTRCPPLRVRAGVARVRLRVERRHSGGATLRGCAHMPPRHAARILRRARGDLFRMRCLWCRKLPPLNLGGELLPIRVVAVRGWLGKLSPIDKREPPVLALFFPSRRGRR